MLSLVLQLRASSVDTISVYSESMHKQVKAVVILPDGYGKKKSSFRYPTTYLLHGYSGSYAQWINDAPQIKTLADQEQIILICPDAGYSSWYFDSPIDSTVRYETFITRELIPYIDSHYKTTNDRKWRAVTGLSMGGHGALYLSIRHQDLFGAAGSICGGVDIRPFPKNWDLSKKLGDTVCCMANWEKNTVINVIDQLQNGQLALIMDCGVGDFFLEVNRHLHQKLLEKKIDHDYTERPGEHNKAYWSNSIAYQLVFFRKFFDKQ